MSLVAYQAHSSECLTYGNWFIHLGGRSSHYSFLHSGKPRHRVAMGHAQADATNLSLEATVLIVTYSASSWHTVLSNTL